MLGIIYISKFDQIRKALFMVTALMVVFGCLTLATNPALATPNSSTDSAATQQQAPTNPVTPPSNAQEPTPKAPPEEPPVVQLVRDAGEKAGDSSVKASKAVAEAKEAGTKQRVAVAEPSPEASDSTSREAAPISGGTASFNTKESAAKDNTNSTNANVSLSKSPPPSSGTTSVTTNESAVQDSATASKDNSNSPKTTLVSDGTAPAPSGAASSTAKESFSKDNPASSIEDKASSAQGEISSVEGAEVGSEAGPISRLASNASLGALSNSTSILGPAVLIGGFLIRKTLLGWLGL